MPVVIPVTRRILVVIPVTRSIPVVIPGTRRIPVAIPGTRSMPVVIPVTRRIPVVIPRIWSQKLSGPRYVTIFPDPNSIRVKTTDREAVGLYMYTSTFMNCLYA
jgi:hypothetical protein